MNNQYDTLIGAIQDLKEKGYTHNFEINEKELLHEIDGEEFAFTEVKLNEYHRFEGMTNPSDSSILYVLETNTGIKGTVVDAYGADGSKVVSDFMIKVE
jgi:mannose-6-phosphate isomerase class I